ncbi:MAG: L-lactate permease [Pseudomonadota bacterium]
MSLILALLPVVASSALIVVWRFTALTAALAGVAVALLVVMVWPEFSVTAQQWQPVVAGTASFTFNIALVLLGGVMLYQVLRAGEGLTRIADWIKSCVTSDMHLLLVVIFGVGVFFESATGFGVGILVTAPLLLAIGFAPMKAAFLALLSQCSVTWGALAIGTVVGAELSGVSAQLLGLYAVPLSVPFLLLCGVTATVAGGLWQTHAKLPLLLWVGIYVTVLSGLQALCTYLFGIELAGCLAGAGVVWFGYLMSRYTSQHQDASSRLPVPVRSVAPFVVLVAGLMISRLIPPVQQWLLSLRVADVAWLYHAGFWLLLAALCGVLLLPLCRQQPASWLKAGLLQWSKAVVAVGGFLLLGQLMKYSGMTAVLAGSASSASGPYYTLFAPALGALGGFLTASNASSNALFMEFQVRAATTLNMPVELVAGVQSAAGSNATMASPGRVVFAAAIVGSDGAESVLLRRMLPLVIGGTLGSAAAMLVLWQVAS